MTGSHELIVDTSAAVAILTNESGADWRLAQPERTMMPAATYLEVGMVMESRLGAAGTGVAARFVRDAEIEVVDLSVAAAERALEGWRRYGKGRHPAKLDFGDCIVYVYGTAVEVRPAGPLHR